MSDPATAPPADGGGAASASASAADVEIPGTPSRNSLHQKRTAESQQTTLSLFYSAPRSFAALPAVTDTFDCLSHAILTTYAEGSENAIKIICLGDTMVGKSKYVLCLLPLLGWLPYPTSIWQLCCIPGDQTLRSICRYGSAAKLVTGCSITQPAMLQPRGTPVLARPHAYFACVRSDY